MAGAAAAGATSPQTCSLALPLVRSLSLLFPAPPHVASTPRPRACPSCPPRPPPQPSPPDPHSDSSARTHAHTSTFTRFPAPPPERSPARALARLPTHDCILARFPSKRTASAAPPGPRARSPCLRIRQRACAFASAGPEARVVFTVGENRGEKIGENCFFCPCARIVGSGFVHDASHELLFLSLLIANCVVKFCSR